MHASETPVISIRDVSHFFGRGALRRQVLFDITCDIRPGEIVIVTGPSGSGKTTVLTLAGALRSVEHGSMQVLGQELNCAGSAALVRIRERIGFIFQAHNLLDSLSAAENVQMALGLDGLKPREARERAIRMLATVGLEDRVDYLPSQLSGGERQRVAVARAVVRRPRIILADEPTAALDKRSGRDVVEVLRQLARREGCAVLLVTHDHRILDIADRIMFLEDGRLGSFGGVMSPHAGHLLTVLSCIPDRESLEMLLGQMPEPEFVRLVKTLAAEFEQFINTLEMGDRDSVRTLFDTLLETVFAKISQLLQAGTGALFLVRGEHLEPATTAGTGRSPDADLARLAAQTGDIVERAGVLCVPLRDRSEQIIGVAQLCAADPAAAGFGASEGRAFRDFAGPLGILMEGCQRMAEGHRRA